jgi:hypothetical protein
VELVAGNQGLYYQTTVKKSFSPGSCLSFFSLATFATDYENTPSANRLLIEAQVSYTIAGGFGIMAGMDMNAVSGFAPIIGPQHTFASKEILSVTIVSLFLNEKKDAKIFGLYEYKPALNKKWSMYNRLQFIYNHSLREGSHNRSYIYLRSGLKKKAMVFGLAANLDWFGPGKRYEDNYGLFIRWEFK